VADRTSKKPFEPGRRVHARIKQQALDRGLICYPMGGTVDGVHGDHVLLAPPFIINDQHIEELVDKLGQSVDAALSS
jgi:adenosylmethionine-8-amino-7-oxononanoate aminotransferase